MKIKKIFGYLFSALDNYTLGASARKLVAFILLGFVGYLHFKFVSNTNSFDFLIADLGGILLCLGIITMEQIIKFKASNQSTSQDQKETDNKEA